jgi:hypothetical protein
LPLVGHAWEKAHGGDRAGGTEVPLFEAEVAADPEGGDGEEEEEGESGEEGGEETLHHL